MDKKQCSRDLTGQVIRHQKLAPLPDLGRGSIRRSDNVSVRSASSELSLRDAPPLGLPIRLLDKADCPVVEVVLLFRTVIFFRSGRRGSSFPAASTRALGRGGGGMAAVLDPSEDRFALEGPTDFFKFALPVGNGRKVGVDGREELVVVVLPADNLDCGLRMLTPAVL